LRNVVNVDTIEWPLLAGGSSRGLSASDLGTEKGSIRVSDKESFVKIDVISEGDV
jgi:hypothetical protein